MTDDQLWIDPRWPRWRARIIVDPDPIQPWGDVLPPTLIVHRRRAEFAREVYLPPDAHRILRAWQDIGDQELFSRHLEFFHGTNRIEHATSHDTMLLIFDTRDYRAHTGATAPVDLSGARAEWQAWLDGNVYAVLIENLRPSGAWTLADSLWGLFGCDYAQQTAQQMLLDCATA